MNIAHVVPYSVKYPLALPNARHTWALALAQQQARDGHHVTLYSHPSSSMSGPATRSLSTAPSDDTHANNLALLRLAVQSGHEIVHSHFDSLHYELEDEENTPPIVATQHWWPYQETVSLAQKSQRKNIWAVPPTRYMYEYDNSMGIASKGVISHGIDLALFKPHNIPRSGRLLYVGRISPEKDIGLALTIAEEANLPLDIIGKLLPKNEPYWRSFSDRVDGTRVRYLGTKTPAELVQYYCSARALIFSSEIHEAFGLTAIEAQACGTPVLMKNEGSRPELVHHGVSGFLCDSIDDFVVAIRAVSSIQSQDCRDFASSFSLGRMVRNYEALYRSLV